MINLLAQQYLLCLHALFLNLESVVSFVVHALKLCTSNQILKVSTLPLTMHLLQMLECLDPLILLFEQIALLISQLRQNLS